MVTVPPVIFAALILTSVAAAKVIVEVVKLDTACELKIVATAQVTVAGSAPTSTDVASGRTRLPVVVNTCPLVRTLRSTLVTDPVVLI